MALARVEFDATNEAGDLLSNVTVEVRLESTNALVSVYSDRAGTLSLGNPFVVADGKIGFHAAGGAYKIVLTAGSYTRTMRYVKNGLGAESDIEAGVIVRSSATRAEIKALDTTKQSMTYLTEEGREGAFFWKVGDYSSMITADTAEGVFLKADAIAANAGAWVRQEASKESGFIVNVRWCGAKGTALVDDTSAIVDAKNICKAAIDAGFLGSEMYFPIGRYLVTSTITIDTSFITLRGHGWKKSLLVRNAAYGHTINVYKNAFMEDVIIDGMGFAHTASLGNNMTGAHVNLDGITNTIVKNCYFESGAYGVILNGCVYPKIHHNFFFGNYQSGVTGYNSIAAILLQTSAVSGLAYNYPTAVNIHENHFSGGDGTYSYTTYPNYQYGLLIKAVEEVHFMNNTMIGKNLFNVYIQQIATNDTIFDVFINNNFIDPAGANAVRIEGFLGDGSQYIGKVQIIGNQINGEGQADLSAVTGSGDGIYVDGTVRAGAFPQACLDLQINDNNIDNWQGHAININGCLSAMVNSNVCRNNNASNTKSASNIRFGATAKKFTVADNQAGYNNAMATGYTTYGIEIASGATDFSITNNDVTGNVTGAILDNSAGATASNKKLITGNLGYNGNRAAVSPTMPASTVDYYNEYGADATVSIFSGTVTDIKLNGQTIFTASGVVFPVGAGDRVSITYSATPSWVWWPR